MKRISVLLIILAISLSFVNNTYSQPKFTINATFGYGVPIGDFKVDLPPLGTRPDADFFPYYTKQLLSFGADGKLAIGKKGNFRATVGFSYNMYTNNADATFRTAAPDTAGVAPTGTVNFKPKVTIISVSLGGEWAFLPKGKVNPFVGASIAGNFFGGNFTFGQPVFVKGAMRTEPMDMKSETRIGFIFDAGVDFKISKSVGAVIGAKYNLINPIGKGADVESEVGPNEIDLGDKEHTLDDGTLSPNKTLSSIMGYVGVSFYFGAPKTVKK
jgi:outer membrane protein W